MRAYAGLALGLLACGGPPSADGPPRAPAARAAAAAETAAPVPPSSATAASSSLAAPASDAPEQRAPLSSGASALLCPTEMSLVWRFQGAYCVDRWEASLVQVSGERTTPWPNNRDIDGRAQQFRAVSRPGVRPQGYISALQARVVCANAGKRLCETDEWVRACRGPALTRYPYGNERRANVCNDRFKVLDHHPVPILWAKDGRTPGDTQMWFPEFMNDPRLHELAHTTVPTGSAQGCTNDYGVFDMVGNLHEWVNDDSGTFFGGFFMDTFQNGEGCEYRTIGHGAEYHDYSIGFRCCADASRGPA